PRGGEVGMAGVADDDGVERVARAPQEPRLRKREARGCARSRTPVPVASVPHRLVSLEHLHPCTPKARDHLRVPRIAPLVRPEVQDPHYARISSTCDAAGSRSTPRSACWLVIISPIRPSEKKWMPTTTSSTPRISSGR